jgi:hypothetical protein
VLILGPIRCGRPPDELAKSSARPLIRRGQICKSRQLPAVILCFLAVTLGDGLMISKSFLLMTVLLISGCSQANDRFYLKKNFTSQFFHADISECKRQNPSFVAVQSYVADSQDRGSYIDDAMVRDCMKAKGYDIQVQRK